MDSCQQEMLHVMLIISAITAAAYALGFTIAHWWAERCIKKQHVWKVSDVSRSVGFQGWNVFFRCDKCGERKSKLTTSVRYLNRLIKENYNFLSEEDIQYYIVRSREYNALSLSDWLNTKNKEK